MGKATVIYYDIFYSAAYSAMLLHCYYAAGTVIALLGLAYAGSSIAAVAQPLLQCCWAACTAALMLLDAALLLCYLRCVV